MFHSCTDVELFYHSTLAAHKEIIDTACRLTHCPKHEAPYAHPFTARLQFSCHQVPWQHVPREQTDECADFCDWDTSYVPLPLETRRVTRHFSPQLKDRRLNRCFIHRTLLTY